jgi:homocysteine S-methyltransferase
VLARMRKATEGGKEAALAEGVKIAREMFALVKKDVQGIQVSAPFGRVEVALEVFK